MTERELDELLRRVLLDAAKLEESRETGEEPTFRPTPRYQRQTRAMWNLRRNGWTGHPM